MPTTEPILETERSVCEEAKAPSVASAPVVPDAQDESSEWRVIIYDLLGDFSEQTGAAFG